MNYRARGLIYFLVLYISSGYQNDLSAQGNCDPSLTKLSSGPLGYRDRGDRCEGVYIKEVGSTTLQVGSFTEFFEAYNLKSGKPLIIEWDKPPAASRVRLRAQGLKRRLYYRMDAYRPAGNLSYSWPTNILSPLNILKSDIGLTGTFPYDLGQVKREIYIPLRIRQEEKAVPRGDYNLVLLPGVELKEVFISLTLLGADGRPGSLIRDGGKLGYGYYPAERGIEIPISGLKDAGIYFLEIGAELRNGGLSTLELWFYHPAD